MSFVQGYFIGKFTKIANKLGGGRKYFGALDNKFQERYKSFEEFNI